MTLRWKRIVLGVAVLLVMIGIAVLYVLNEMKKPLFVSGTVRDESVIGAALEPPAQPDTPGFWRVTDDIRLSHFSDGNGPPVLVVHGGPGLPFAEPLPALALLSGDFAFHYYDQRGSGGSTKPFNRFDAGFTENLRLLEAMLGLGAQVADIERIRRILGAERIDLIGHSFGGFIAALYAAEFPDHVGRLVLAAPADVLVLPNENDLFKSIGNHLSKERKPAYEDFLARYFDFGSVFDKSEAELIALNAEIIPFYAEAAAAKGAPVPEDYAPSEPGGWMPMAVFFSMGGKADFRPPLANVTARTLVLHGAEDLQTEGGSRSYADAIPGAEFVVLPDTGHFVFHQNIESVGETIGDFLRQ